MTDERMAWFLARRRTVAEQARSCPDLFHRLLYQELGRRMDVLLIFQDATTRAAFKEQVAKMEWVGVWFPRPGDEHKGE